MKFSHLFLAILAATPRVWGSSAAGWEAALLFQSYRLEYDVFGEDAKLAPDCKPRPCDFVQFLGHITNSKHWNGKPASVTLSSLDNPTNEEASKVTEWAGKDPRPNGQKGYTGAMKQNALLGSLYEAGDLHAATIDKVLKRVQAAIEKKPDAAPDRLAKIKAALDPIQNYRIKENAKNTIDDVDKYTKNERKSAKIETKTETAPDGTKYEALDLQATLDGMKDKGVKDTVRGKLESYVLDYESKGKGAKHTAVMNVYQGWKDKFSTC